MSNQNLDDRLKEILPMRCPDCGDMLVSVYDLKNHQVDIRQVKQAFADEGWNPPLTDESMLEIIAKMDEAKGKYLTGPEWYERFEKELQEIAPKRFTEDDFMMMSEALEAAKKAAGLS